MSDDPRPSGIPLSEDQRAVKEYLESTLYRETSQRKKSASCGNYTIFDSLCDLFPRSPRDLGSTMSFTMGLAGLNGILLLIAGLSPLAMYWGQNVIRPSGGYLMMMTFIQSVILPPLIAFSFATVTPMFWYGSVLLRFGVGMLMVIPGCLVFIGIFVWLEGMRLDDQFLRGFSGVMFTQFLVAGSVALVIQMWSPWTLSHARDSEKPLPPLGTLAILELTGVAAIGSAVFISDDYADILEGILFFGAMGLISSVAVIAVLIALLRTGRRNPLSTVAAILASLAMAWLMCGFGAVQEFGWDSLWTDMLTISAAAVYGGILILAVMWSCVAWLRVCGWSCINRNQERLRLNHTDSA